MNGTSSTSKRAIVIGGGITGLAAAHRLIELNPQSEVVLLESSHRLGGVLDTVRKQGFLIERSADNFISNVPAGVDLCRRVGLGDQLLNTASGQRTALVVRRGRLQKVPAGFLLLAPTRLGPVLTTPLLSPWGKLRLLAETIIPPRSSTADESLGSFARRRLGRETFERIVQPLVGGIYTADPEKLSLRATLPRFVEMERRYGSLIRGAWQQREAEAAQLGPSGSSAGEETDSTSGARYGLFVAPRDGMSSLVDAVAARLPAGSVQLNCPVQRISRSAAGQWTVELAAGPLTADALIVAIGADRAAPLLADCSPELAGLLQRIPYAGTVIVSLAFPRGRIANPLDGFGFVVPAIERRRILAGSFASLKYTGRAPDDSVLIRVFIGGACQPELAELDDDRLRAIAIEELSDLLRISGDPLLCDIARWPASMPQYHLGHNELVAQIEQLAGRWDNFALAGNAYHGVGVPTCIASGESAAERVAHALK